MPVIRETYFCIKLSGSCDDTKVEARYRISVWESGLEESEINITT
jgi:hypothetical protein